MGRYYICARCSNDKSSSRGVPAEMMTPNPFKVVQTPGLVMLVFEQFSYFRQILMDGRPHPDNPEPTWFGYRHK